jgi:hypothetical protein
MCRQIGHKKPFLYKKDIYAEVVTRVAGVAGSLEARGLPGYPESLVVEMNVMKS